MGLADLVIGISGNIGVGKTTLIEAASSPEFQDILLSILDVNQEATRKIASLSEDFDLKMLGNFYQEPKRFAFAAQMYFLNARLRREEAISNTRGIVLVDRPIIEDYYVFGRAQRVLGNMTENEFRVYAETFDLMNKKITPPDIYVYLRSDVETLQKRIAKRNRPEEKSLLDNPEYLQTLHHLYEDLHQNKLDESVIVIDAKKMKLGSNGELDKEYLREVLQQIASQVKSNPPSLKLEPQLGKWISTNPPEAVLKTIELEKELTDYLNKNQKIITVAGNVGLGKTTTTRILAHGLGIESSFELDKKHDLIDYELLSKFLQDKPRYCNELQVELIKRRLALRNKNKESGLSVIEDRSPEEDPAAFQEHFRNRGYLTERQLDVLQTESRSAYRSAAKSDLMIVLQGTPEYSRQRILHRGRPEEIAAWDLVELRDLHKLYQEFPGNVGSYGLHQGPIITLDVSKIDVTNRIHQGFVYEQMLKALKS
ncbi:deoxynucleoside kinase [Candidatus Woesearchaeota archaeon]|nr:deoxynucleoside kinase [Candidatus Woesearchaeota archaeon]